MRKIHFIHRIKLAFAAFCLIQTGISFGYSVSPVFLEPAGLRLLRSAYPDVQFKTVYDFTAGDWKIEVNGTVLYWADGRMLAEHNLDDKDSFRSLMYSYGTKIPDPASFSAAHIQEIRRYTSTENRRSQEGASMDFFDAVYDSATRRAVEQHITQIFFLGKKTNVHERIAAPLRRVDQRIKELAQADTEVQNFINSLSRVDSYNWREIGDRSSRSFHSCGIAVDILPKGWGKKNIYWAWRRDIDPENWMLLPLERRWMPPVAVIEAFEDEGFIWGGKWIVWDNMHFEYHPELIAYNNIR